MLRSAALTTGLLTASAALGACTQGAEVTRGQSAEASYSPTYLGIETNLLDSDLVIFRVAMTGAREEKDVEAYGRCAAAQYALIRGFGFARHVSTTTSQDDRIWRADAAYLISDALPEGLRTFDAKMAVGDCAERGIPTV
jgi:hypothetical protein